MTISQRTRIALNRETTWGTPSATWNLLPCNPPTLTQAFESILDQGVRGVNIKDFGVYRGAGRVEATLEGLFYPEELGFLILGVMGSIATTAGTPTTHVFVAGDGIPSFSIEDHPSLQLPGSPPTALAYVYQGCYVSSLGIKFSAAEGACTYTATLVGRAAGTQTPATVIGTPSAPFLGWQGSVDIADKGAGLTPYGRMVSAEWTFSRETVLQHALNLTNQPSFGYAGPLEVTLSAVVQLAADADISRFRTDTRMRARTTLTYGSGTALKSLMIDCTDMFFENAPAIDRGAVDVKANWSLRALYDTALGTPTPVTITLRNHRTGYAA